MLKGTLILKLLLLVLGAAYSETAREFYIAAVFDYGAGGTPLGNVTNRNGALEVLNYNLDVLEDQAEIASSKGAELFVFPEYGLSGRIASREHASYFVETIPDPHTAAYCPSDKAMAKDEEVLYRLSSISKNNSIYIAANMGDKQPCKNSDRNCPIIGYYQYNTEVVFNQSGCLVARYHKQNLFEAEKLWWNVPMEVEYSYFDTDFGRFGLMICFDAVFKSPATDLVEKYNVTDIIFSTAWMNVFPHYESVTYHSGWARTMKVNFLSSNLHFPPQRLIGSGIFTPDDIVDYVFNRNSLESKLIVAKVPVNNRSKPPIKDRSKTVELSKNAEYQSSNFKAEVFGDLYNFVPLIGLKGNQSVCHGSVCCYLEFSRSNNSELYALGAFNGMHYLEGTYYLEVCLLVMCPYNKTGLCGTEPKNATTTFDYFNLTSIMNTIHAYPQLVPLGFNFSENFTFLNEGKRKSIIGGIEKPILSIVHMGRNFDKDRTLTNFQHTNTATVFTLSPIISFCLFMYLTPLLF